MLAGSKIALRMRARRRPHEYLHLDYRSPFCHLVVADFCTLGEVVVDACGDLVCLLGPVVDVACGFGGLVFVVEPVELVCPFRCSSTRGPSS